jgi:sortase B
LPKAESESAYLKILAVITVIVLAVIFFYGLYARLGGLLASLPDRAFTKTVQREYKAVTVQAAADREARFRPFREMNDDTVGWLCIPGTKIDYPVVKTTDNLFYLDHNMQKQPSRLGAIFMDYRDQGDGTDRNTILYGHHLPNDPAMFADLIKYKDSSYFRDHRFIQLATLNKDIRWEIFAVYITDPRFDYIQTDFTGADAYRNFLAEIACRSLYATRVTVSAADAILTLSTCTYEFADARLVIQAKPVSGL